MIKEIHGLDALPKSYEVLVTYKKGMSMIDISRNMEITYSFLSHIIKRLQEKNFIIVSKNGRKSLINLTKKGQTLRDSIIKIIILTKQ